MLYILHAHAKHLLREAFFINKIKTDMYIYAQQRACEELSETNYTLKFSILNADWHKWWLAVWKISTSSHEVFGRKYTYIMMGQTNNLHVHVILTKFLSFLGLVVVRISFASAEKVFINNGWFEWLYEPTREELQRGIAIQPDLSWAHQARNEKSARVVALGILIVIFNNSLQLLLRWFHIRW